MGRPCTWRSELRHVLALDIRKDLLSFEQAYTIQTEAETPLADSAYKVPSRDVLRLVESSDCSAYDCEFSVLAKRMNTKLVTADKKIPKEFPAMAMTLAHALARHP